MNPAPFSASCADDITVSIILDMTWVCPFGVGGGESGRIGKCGLSLRKRIPPARDRARDSHR